MSAGADHLTFDLQPDRPKRRPEGPLPSYRQRASRADRLKRLKSVSAASGSMNAFGPGINRRNYDMSGNADTKDEAAALVERCYDACREPT
jgi:hypothetical protein